MNRELVEKIVKAMLYEGYMLYPYRASALKNQQRWNFGVLFPERHNLVIAGVESSRMQSECLVVAGAGATIRARVKFLHLVERSVTDRRAAAHEAVAAAALPEPAARTPQPADSWQETDEREIVSPDIGLTELCSRTTLRAFRLAPSDEEELLRGPCGNPVVVRRMQEMIEGAVELRAAPVDDQVFKLTVQISNMTPVEGCHFDSRERALRRSMISTHTILEINGGEFMSIIDPAERYRDAARACRNIGTWPVLVGEEGERDCMLASPIILYDYPQVAPESAGDFFDSTEIDEMLALRVMTLTEEEKQTMREGDRSARRILERTESMPQEQVMKLHGALRGLREIKRGG